MIIFQKLYIECDEDFKFNTELQKIYGIGKNNKLYKKYGFTKRTLFGIVNLKRSLEYHLESYILKNRIVSYPLKQNIQDNIRKKIALRIYQGFRHKVGLPVHGQRTHSNCKTVRRAFKKALSLLPQLKQNILQAKKNKKLAKQKKKLEKNAKKKTNKKK